MRSAARWPDNDLVFTTQRGTPLDAANVRRAFRHVAEHAGLPAEEWTPRELRHSFVSLLSSAGIPIEDIAHLVGHANTRTTEKVYRKELRPVLRRGAKAMDDIFKTQREASEPPDLPRVQGHQTPRYRDSSARRRGEPFADRGTVMTAEDSGQPSSELTITEHELAECKRVNATGRQPVVFVHGLWLLPSSWDRWATLFEENGYAALAPGWPDDPETVEEAKAHPEVFAGKSIGQVADHFETIIRGLDKKPAVIGHSFGGLLTQILAGRGLAAVSVAIDPAQFRGVLPLPISALKSAFPVLGNPANRNRAIPLTYDQFRYAFANAVSEEEAKQLHETYAVPTAGKPLFQAAAANFNPWTDAKVDTKNRERGPLLIISGEMDHTVPPAVVKAAYKQQQDNEGVTEIVEIKNRGHALTIDSGWREVAETALAFVKRFT